MEWGLRSRTGMTYNIKYPRDTSHHGFRTLQMLYGLRQYSDRTLIWLNQATMVDMIKIMPKIRIQICINGICTVSDDDIVYTIKEFWNYCTLQGIAMSKVENGTK